MLAFGLCIGLFLYFLLTGSAVVRALHAKRSAVQDLLLAPAVGVGAVVIPTFLLNRAGLPVITFAKVLAPLVAVLAIAAHVVMSRRRTARHMAEHGLRIVKPLRQVTGSPLTHYLPFLVVILVGAVLTGRPMLSYGFDWVSFVNEDMTNYTLAAERFLHYGFNATPAIESLRDGLDYSQTYWFLHVPAMVRAGADLVIAWTCGTTGVTVHAAFMPVIVAFHLCLISAAAGIVYTSAERRTAALLTAILVATSAQLAFGAIYQLIAQTIGLAILAVNVSLLCRPFQDLPGRQLVRHGILVAWALTTQLILYPEVNPFLAAAFGAYTVVALVRRRAKVKPLVLVLAAAAVVVVVLLNTYLVDVVEFMILQKGPATLGDKPAETLFPYFLLPSGLANYWGLHRLAAAPDPDPWNSVQILAGLALTLIAAGAVLWLAWRAEPTSCVALVCGGLGAVLFAGNVGFGLYKLAMFAQPFVLGSLAVAWVTLVRSRPDKWWLDRTHWRLRPLFPSLIRGGPMRFAASCALLSIAIPGLWVQAELVNLSKGLGGGFTEVIGASKDRVLVDLKRIAEIRPPGREAGPQPTAIGANQPAMIFDTINAPLAKLFAVYSINRPVVFTSNWMENLIHFTSKNRPAVAAEAERVFRPTWDRVDYGDWDFDPEHPKTALGGYLAYNSGGRPHQGPDPDDTLLVTMRESLSILNGRRYQNEKSRFVVLPVGKVRDHLIYRETMIGRSYRLTDQPKLISFYQIEFDPIFYPNQPIGGLGRYLCFEVIRPDPKVRVVVELSCSLQGDGKNELPTAASAYGAKRAAIPFVGRGSGRVFSEPLSTRDLFGRPHLSIDFGRWGEQFPTVRKGAMALFGKQVSMDRRFLIGFGRDVSLIGEDEYAALKPPSAITHWGGTDRADLRNPDLEYSGIYEDGWVAERSFVTLGQPAAKARPATKPSPATKPILAADATFRIKGEIPDIQNPNFKTTTLTVTVDGKPVTLKGTQAGQAVNGGTFTYGPFEATADLPPAAPGVTRRRVDMTWSAVQPLRSPDNRPAAAQLQYVGLEAAGK